MLTPQHQSLLTVYQVNFKSNLIWISAGWQECNLISAETPEVQHAKALHFAAVAKASGASGHGYVDAYGYDDGSYKPQLYGDDGAYKYY